MFWELLQKILAPKGLSWVPQAAGLLLGSSLANHEKLDDFPHLGLQEENVTTKRSMFNVQIEVDQEGR